ncbi:MAG: cysteine hydrolase [Desulfatitalea sp.]|nr:cysteine hydrolase [Desulfatitalea sp.]NNK02660.1 cysteine hydrolase [Desulfatitalea sp.]
MEKEKPALLIIDMINDYFNESENMPITGFGKAIIPCINRMIRHFHERDWPVVFSTDAFEAEDFFFTGKMRPHAISETKGAQVIDALDKQDHDYWLPKPRMSAFFKTGLEKWLRERSVTLCAVGGLATPFCVLTTVLDAINHDFKGVLLSDCSAAATKIAHEHTVGTYRRNVLYPLLRVMTSDELTTTLPLADDLARTRRD